MLKNTIQIKLNEIFTRLTNQVEEIKLDTYKSIKSKLSAKVTAEELGITEPMLFEFEEALKQYFQFRGDHKKGRISCLRLSLWLETICKNLNISFSLNESISNNIFFLSVRLLVVYSKNSKAVSVVISLCEMISSLLTNKTKTV